MRPGAEAMAIMDWESRGVATGPGARLLCKRFYNYAKGATGPGARVLQNYFLKLCIGRIAQWQSSRLQIDRSPVRTWMRPFACWNCQSFFKKFQCIFYNHVCSEKASISFGFD